MVRRRQGLRLGVIASAALLAGCITVETTGQSSAQAKRQITSSQFYRDSALFFPEDRVADARRPPPPLTPKQRAVLEADLNRQLAIVRKLAASPVMAKVFGDQTPLPPKTRVVLTNFNAAEAQTIENGEIAIDVRVIQALLRSALVTQYHVEIELERIKARRPIKDPYTAEEEALALNTFLAARAHVRDAKGRSMMGDLIASTRSDDSALDLTGLSQRSRDLSGLDVRYDSEMLFLVAHEVGHLALNHFSSHAVVLDLEDDPDECALRRAKERAADVYATTLIAIGTPAAAVNELFGSMFQAGVTVGDGFDTFFNYAYDYAGFTSGGVECRSYPPPAERLASMQKMYKAIREGQTNAILENAKPARK